MKERPILFNSEMVRAVLDGRKTQTRRVVKPQPPEYSDEYVRAKDGSNDFKFCASLDNHATMGVSEWMTCPYGVPGDRLWVRETFCEAVDMITSQPFDPPRALYKADGNYVVLDDGDGCAKTNRDGTESSPWKPSIHMPRWASRILLEVVSVRVERVREISVEDIAAEGVDNGASNPTMGMRHGIMQMQAWSKLWDSINRERGYGWEVNPWVWVVEFKRISQ